MDDKEQSSKYKTSKQVRPLICITEIAELQFQYEDPLDAVSKFETSSVFKKKEVKFVSLSQERSSKGKSSLKKPFKLTITISGKFYKDFSINISRLPGNNLHFLTSVKVKTSSKNRTLIQFPVSPSCYCIYFNPLVEGFCFKQVIENGESINCTLTKNLIIKLPLKLSYNQIIAVFDLYYGDVKIRFVDYETRRKTTKTLPERFSRLRIYELGGLILQRKGDWVSFDDFSNSTIKVECMELQLGDTSCSFQKLNLQSILSRL